MKHIRYIVVLGFALKASFLSGCYRADNSSSESAAQTKPGVQITHGKGAPLSTDPEYQRESDRDFAIMTKLHEQLLRNPPPKRVRLPNFPAGPGSPQPVGVNFYEQDDRYPDYLLCFYDVRENHYDVSNEPAWFAAALSQIRGTGASRFPPFRWVAVIIANRAEHKDAATFEKSRKVGAIFNASGVFDLRKELKQLIARAELDRHPFVYDPTQPTPGEQQRWVIVERHARSQAASSGNGAASSGNGVGEERKAAP